MSIATFTADRLKRQTDRAQTGSFEVQQCGNGGGFASAALWLIAVLSVIDCAGVYFATSNADGDQVAVVNMKPVHSRLTALLLSSGTAAAFLLLAIFSTRKPFYCACLGLGLFVSINATGTYIAFQDVNQTLAWNERVYEQMCVNYAIAWLFRLIPIAMLCFGIRDTIPSGGSTQWSRTTESSMR